MFQDIKNVSQRPVTMVFTGAESDREVEYHGERIYVESATNDFTIKLDSRSDVAKTMKAKKSIVIPFRRFFITTTGANTIVFFLSNPAEVHYEESDVNVDEIQKLEKTSTGSYVHVTVGATAELIDAADETRKRLSIQNWSANPVFIGFDALVTTANAGVRLAQYDAKDIDKYTGAVYAIAAGAGNDVAKMKEGG